MNDAQSELRNITSLAAQAMVRARTAKRAALLEENKRLKDLLEAERRRSGVLEARLKAKEK